MKEWMEDLLEECEMEEVKMAKANRTYSQVSDLIDQKVGEKIRLENEIQKLEDELSIMSSRTILNGGYLLEGEWRIKYDPYTIELESTCSEFPIFIEKFCKGYAVSYVLAENIRLQIRYEDDEMHIRFTDNESFKYLGDEVVGAFILENKLNVVAHRMVDRNVERCEADMKHYVDYRDRVNALLSLRGK